MRFTDRGVKALKPRDTRYEVFEDGRKGLELRNFSQGREVLGVRVPAQREAIPHHSGRLSGHECGRCPRLPRQASCHAQEGRRSGASRTNHETRGDRRPTVTQLAQLYIERYAKVCKRSWHEDERILEKDAIPRWEHIKAKDIKRRRGGPPR
jgi:hypothetical protein